MLRRHQTRRAALERSHALLNAAEQRVLRRLGVFAGGFTLAMAQQVAEDEAGGDTDRPDGNTATQATGIDAWDVLEHLGALIDKSLVLAEGDAQPRYRLLETTRLFALERLANAGETAALLRRHAVAVQPALTLAPGSATRLESLADWARLTAEPGTCVPRWTGLRAVTMIC